jgi:hypothetical protein
MAKISAHGATEVARERSSDTGGTWLLASDGRILRKSGLAGDNWTVAGRLKPGVPVTADTLHRFMVRHRLVAA